MTIAAKFLKSHVINACGLNTLQLYVDYSCPFSAKHYIKWYNELFPLANEKSWRIEIYQVIQTWHVGSVYMNEIGIAVALLAPEKWVEFSLKLYKNQDKWFDSKIVDKTRYQVYKELCDFATEETGVAQQSFMDLLKLQGNDNALSKYVKYFTRHHRERSIHMTPTVLVNGIRANSIESSTPTEDSIAVIEGMVL